MYKASQGVICVGRQTADTSGTPNGNNIPVTNVTPWGNATPQNESAILVYYQAANLYNPNDSIQVTGIGGTNLNDEENEITVYPNPTSAQLFISFRNQTFVNTNWKFKLTDIFGRTVKQGNLQNQEIDLSIISSGMYQLQISNDVKTYSKKIIVESILFNR